MDEMEKVNKFSMLALLLVLALALVACSNANSGMNAPATPDGTTMNEDEAVNEETAPDERGPEDELIEETGIYIGQADSHTIEISVEDNPVAYQITQGLEEDVAKLSENDPVKYLYYERPVEGETDLKQLIITEIVKTDE